MAGGSPSPSSGDGHARLRGEDGNCSTLLDCTESVRRVALDAELPAEERFDIAAGDTLVYNKPGYVPGDECVDVALLADGADGSRYLLAVETPEDGWLCPGLVEMATATLEFLEQAEG